MKNVFLGVTAFFAFIILLLGLTWIFQGNDFFLYRYFAPKEEAVRREVFEQSKAYNQGMIQELDNFYLEYGKADDEHKKAISSVVLHRFADYSDDKLPAYLKEFIQNLRRERAAAR